MKSRIVTWLAAALAAAGFGDGIEIMVEYSRPGHEGDLSTGVALALARGGEAGESPKEIAERIVAALEMIDGPARSVAIAPNGYINIRYSSGFLAECAVEAVEFIASRSSLGPLRRNGTVRFRRAGLPVDRWPDGDEITVASLIERSDPETFRWFLLAGPAAEPLTIDLDLALDKSDRNPLNFIRYTHAHITALLAFAAELRIPPAASISPSDLESLDSGPERALMKSIAMLPDIVERSVNDGETHPLAQALLEVTRLYHDASRTAPIIGAEAGRRAAPSLSLASLTARALAGGLALLGIPADGRI